MTDDDGPRRRQKFVRGPGDVQRLESGTNPKPVPARARRPRSEKIGDAEIRIVPTAGGYRGVIIRNREAGEILEDLDFERLKARLRNEAGKLHPDYIGMDGAISRFLRYFPGGFADEGYRKAERDYKERARRILIETVPLEQADRVDPEQARACRKVTTNLLSSLEAARLAETLSGPSGPDFIKAAARFTGGDIAAGICSMVKAVAPSGRASWPILTYLPFLWRPDRHMFLKPEKTLNYAQRIGHAFQHDYVPGLEPEVYDSLLGLAAHTEAGIARLAPIDRIDVQSFIWVVGSYADEESLS
ncbi:hypothetical protein [Sphingosinicella sp.]|uniref:hypothetical protein n=1 Tax=Sphingosinicella sp. TaxID=1917971 RepID=UPI00403777C3